MHEDECLRRYGLRPSATDLDEVRRILAARTELERRAPGGGDTSSSGWYDEYCSD